jgi:hypothetical protein
MNPSQESPLVASLRISHVSYSIALCGVPNTTDVRPLFQSLLRYREAPIFQPFIQSKDRQTDRQIDRQKDSTPSQSAIQHHEPRQTHPLHLPSSLARPTPLTTLHVCMHTSTHKSTLQPCSSQDQHERHGLGNAGSASKASKQAQGLCAWLAWLAWLID